MRKPQHEGIKRADLRATGTMGSTDPKQELAYADGSDKRRTLQPSKCEFGK